MADQATPFVDHAAPILAGEPSITDDQRADLWDAFHSKNPNELIQHLQPLGIPDETKQRLVDAKKKSMPTLDPLEKISAVLTHMSQIPPEQLELAESHPNVLKTLTAALDKASESDSEGGPAEAKGKPQSSGKKPAALAPDVPATPSGHALVHASDGGHYHMPVESLDKARTIDPKLTVLHVEP